MIKYTLRYKGLLFLANVAMVISSLGSIYLPLLCGSIIDDIRQENDLTENSIKFVILTLGMAIFSSLRGYCFNILGEKIVMDMRK